MLFSCKRTHHHLLLLYHYFHFFLVPSGQAFTARIHMTLPETKESMLHSDNTHIKNYHFMEQTPAWVLSWILKSWSLRIKGDRNLPLIFTSCHLIFHSYHTSHISIVTLFLEWLSNLFYSMNFSIKHIFTHSDKYTNT